MTLQSIPLTAVASQIVTVQLSGQPVKLNVYQKTFGLFVDVYVNDALIIGGVLAHDRNWIVRSGYLGFLGDLFFMDTQGTSDPVYTGLGARYSLMYWAA